MKAYFKRAETDSVYYNKEVELVDLDIKYCSEYARQLIGKDCLVEFVPLNSEMTLFMGVDENGHAKGLPFNFFIELSNPFADKLELLPSRVDPIVGNVIFVRVKKNNDGCNFEVDNIAEQDYMAITRLLHPANQKRLCDAYRARVGI